MAKSGIVTFTLTLLVIPLSVALLDAIVTFILIPTDALAVMLVIVLIRSTILKKSKRGEGFIATWILLICGYLCFQLAITFTGLMSIHLEFVLSGQLQLS